MTRPNRRRASSSTLYPRRRRSRPGLPTTIGTAVGALVVTTLLDLSWPARAGLVLVVVLVGLAYVLWRHRAEIAAAAQQGASPAGPPEPSEASPPTPPSAQ